MLQCRKCHIWMSDGAAHQSIREMTESLLASRDQAAASSKAAHSGPLCDLCLAQWTRKGERLTLRKSSMAQYESG
jgi:hypothetical protein